MSARIQGYLDFELSWFLCYVLRIGNLDFWKLVVILVLGVNDFIVVCVCFEVLLGVEVILVS
mgnify:CR=1 FL=1